MSNHITAMPIITFSENTFLNIKKFIWNQIVMTQEKTNYYFVFINPEEQNVQCLFLIN